MMRNRWGVEVKVGHWVSGRGGRDGTQAFEGKVLSIDRTSEYARAYGAQVKIAPTPQTYSVIDADAISQTLGPMTVSKGGIVKQNPLGNLPNLRKRYAAVILTLSDLRAEKRKRGFDPGMAGYTLPEISDLIARFQVKASDLRAAINHYGESMKSNPLARIKTPGQKSQLTGKKPSKRLIQRRLKTEKLGMPGVYANPKVRTSIKAPSQRERFDPEDGPTKEASARLIKRRKLNQKMVPAGFFANPSARTLAERREIVCEAMHYVVAGNDVFLASFANKPAADEYCGLIQKAHPTRNFFIMPL